MGCDRQTKEEMTKKLFCEFQTLSTGRCLMYTPDGSGICKKHFGLKEKPKTQKIKKFRGDSNWGRENGMFKHK